MRGSSEAGTAGAAGTAAAHFEPAHFDFENGFAGWNLKRLVGAHSANIQAEIVRVGTKACRFELRPGDYVSEGRRAELRDPFNAPLEATVWYGFASYIPEDYPVAEDVGCVLAQWHDQAVLGDPSGKPPIALRYRNGSLKVTGAYGKFASPDPDRRYEFVRVPRLERGVWHDFVFRVLWSRYGTSEIEAWLDGSPLFAWDGKLAYENEAEGPYFKIGVYCSESFRTPHAAVHDNYSRGHSYEEVDPSRLHRSWLGDG